MHILVFICFTDRSFFLAYFDKRIFLLFPQRLALSLFLFWGANRASLGLTHDFGDLKYQIGVDTPVERKTPSLPEPRSAARVGASVRVSAAMNGLVLDQVLRKRKSFRTHWAAVRFFEVRILVAL